MDGVPTVCETLQDSSSRSSDFRGAVPGSASAPAHGRMGTTWRAGAIRAVLSACLPVGALACSSGDGPSAGDEAAYTSAARAEETSFNEDFGGTKTLDL